jgi:hypothetical protein
VKKFLIFAALLCGCRHLPLQAQVAVTPYRTPRATFTTSTGQPLSGGCVFTYQGGTSTPQATYTDYTGVTSNPNPVILDSTGSAIMWLGPNTYKFVVYSAGGTNCSTGSLQYTVDQVTGSTYVGVTISGATITNPTITGGTMDGATVGATTPAPVNGSYFNGPIGTGGGTPGAGAFTSLASAFDSVSFSGTPIFNAALYGNFSMTLSGNVTSSSITGGLAGQQVNFNICQNSTGGYTFAWPGSLVNIPNPPPVVNPVANACTVVSAIYNGSVWNVTYSNVYFPNGNYDVIASSATPIFPAGSYSNMLMVLTQNVTSSTLTGGTSGQIIGITLCQNASSWTVVWPTNLGNAPVVNPVPNACTAITAIYNGSAVIPQWTTIGAVNASFPSSFVNIQAVGTQTISGCTLSSAKGGAQAGEFLSGTTGTCTFTVTPGITANTGWTCWANDLTTPADVITEITSITTAATLQGTTVSGDKINWGCLGY